MSKPSLNHWVTGAPNLQYIIQKVEVTSGRGNICETRRHMQKKLILQEQIILMKKKGTSGQQDCRVARNKPLSHEIMKIFVKLTLLISIKTEFFLPAVGFYYNSEYKMCDIGFEVRQWKSRKQTQYAEQLKTHITLWNTFGITDYLEDRICAS